jgi:carbon-monoxide dehydrogenase medium subunit
VKPAPFEYRSPESVEEAVALLAEHGDEAQVLAGGQSLLPMMALRLARPTMVVDVGRIAELSRMSTADGLGVGAVVSQRAVERSSAAAAHCPLLHQAVPFIGHPAIRTRGTIGGSLAHADPAAELPAVAAALEAELVLRRSGGERTVTAEDFYLGYLTTARRPDELVVEIRFRAAAAGTTTAFVEISRRHGDFALVACAAALTLDGGGLVTQARLALAGVDTVPLRARRAEAALVGQPAGAAAWREAAAAAASDLRPASDIHATAAYRRHVAGVLTGRALAAAAQSEMAEKEPAR